MRKQNRVWKKIKEGKLKKLTAQLLWMYLYVRRYWLLIAFYVLLGASGSVLSLGFSLVTRDLVDAVTGMGMEKWEYMEFDGTEDWYKNDQNGYFVGDVIDIGPNGRRESKSNIAVNSVDQIFPIPNGQFNTWSFTTQLGWVGFSLSFADSLDSWKSYLAAQAAAGTPVTIAYKLATPQPITATGGQQINALAGVNTVMTDADGVTVTGRADPVATVQVLTERVAALEQAAVNAIGG